MGLASNVLILIELAHATQVIRIPIQVKQNEMSLYKLFMDPSGKHIIITSTQGQNWHLYRTTRKLRPLKTFNSHKLVIESIAWNKAAMLSNSQPTSTREILIGARNGTIYEAMINAEDDFFKSQERYLQPVFSLPELHPITGVKYDFFPPTDPKRALVVVTTPSRIYQFVGAPDRRSDDSGRIFTSLFAAYRDTVPKILELPGDTRHSELHYYTSNPEQALSLPRSLAWMTGKQNLTIVVRRSNHSIAPGIYHGNLNFESVTDDFIDAADVLPYSISGNAAEVPVSIALTDFHYVILYKNRISGVCHLNDKLTYEEPLPLVGVNILFNFAFATNSSFPETQRRSTRNYC